MVRGLVVLLSIFSHCSSVGVPVLVRSDCGTENSTLATCQMLLRHNHGDEFHGEKSFRYGSSTTNTVCIYVSTQYPLLPFIAQVIALNYLL